MTGYEAQPLARRWQTLTVAVLACALLVALASFLPAVAHAATTAHPHRPGGKIIVAVEPAQHVTGGVHHLADLDIATVVHPVVHSAWVRAANGCDRAAHRYFISSHSRAPPSLTG